jgi:hypothetical protein
MLDYHALIAQLRLSYTHMFLPTQSMPGDCTA